MVAAACGPQVTLDSTSETGSDSGSGGVDGSRPGGEASSRGGGGDDGGPGSAVTSDAMPTSGPAPGSSGDTAPGDTTSDPATCDPPCRPGEVCIAGLCFRDPDDTCVAWGEDGNYADCVAGGPRVCDGAACILDNPSAPTAGACAVLGCTDVCDCPDPGDMTGTLVCEPLTGDEQNGCFFSCEAGTACPPGMDCLGGFFCSWSGGAQTYGDCVDGQACAAGDCFGGDPLDPSVGVCTQPCGGIGDCPPAPPGGTAACTFLPGGMDPQCVLTCENGTPCPAGMVCHADAVCGWPVP